MADGKKQVLLSGIQPSGKLTIANYIGAIRNWLEFQQEYDCYFILVDLHAITTRQDPKKLLDRCYEFLALYVATGLDPEKSNIFVQSHVHGHSELAWILNCFTYMGELGRMTQFKDKSKDKGENVSAGLFNYPVLMAADILLYDTDLVPVGQDQKQHLELTRDIAMRFNNIYGDALVVPDGYYPKVGAKITKLQDPSSKMDKSDENPNNSIFLLDEADEVRKKIKRAVTDSGRDVVYDEERAGIANLMSIYSSITGEGLKEIEEKYKGKGYGDFKGDLGEVVVEFLKPVQERYRSIIADRDGLAKMLARNAARASERAEKMIDRLHEVLGFIPARSG